MAFSDNERVQEFFFLVGDKFATVGRAWWYALACTLIGVFPAYFLMKQAFVTVALNNYRPPQIIYTSPVRQPLQILETRIFRLNDNAYSAYMKIKNLNLEWGVLNQEYTAEFKSLTGVTVAKIGGSAFILPASEKLIVFSRFTSEQKPENMAVILAPTNFIHKPEVSFNFDLERVNIQNQAEEMTVYAGIKNLTAFTIKQLNLPVAVYDGHNQIVAVNFTSINDLKSGETRTFQYFWPVSVTNALRAEVVPELNIFDPNVFDTEDGISPFENSGR